MILDPKDATSRKRFEDMLFQDYERMLKELENRKKSVQKESVQGSLDKGNAEVEKEE